MQVSLVVSKLEYSLQESGVVDPVVKPKDSQGVVGKRRWIVRDSWIPIESGDECWVGEFIGMKSGADCKNIVCAVKRINCIGVERVLHYFRDTTDVENEPQEKLTNQAISFKNERFAL